MKLFAYFARAQIGTYLLVQIGLAVIVVCTSMIESAGQLSRAGASGETVLAMAAYNAVIYGYQLFPVACLLAVLVTGTVLARSGELLATQAAGLSPVRTAAALAAAVLLFTGGAIAAGEWLVPRALEAQMRLQRQELRGAGDTLGRFYQRRTEWYRHGELLLHLPEVDREANRFANVAVYTLRGGLIASATYAQELAHDGAAWRLRRASVHDVQSGNVTTSPELELPIAVGKDALLEITGDPRTLPARDVLALAERRREAGLDFVPHRLELHARLAVPLAAPCLVLLIVPWALDPNRRRSLAVSLGAGVAVVAALLSLSQVFRMLALAHRLPPWAGAWAIDLVTLAALPASLVLYRRTRRRGGLA